jgi:Protein kinase domain
VKIGDFGLSNMMRDGEFLKTSCGSPNYAAPEVISGQLYAGPEVDVWSCGVILYALLCGTLPFDEEYVPALFQKIKDGDFTVPSYISASCKDLICSMLRVDPIRRITVAEIRQHEWFLHELPQYLSEPAATVTDQILDVDETVLAQLMEQLMLTDRELTIHMLHNPELHRQKDARKVVVAYHLIFDRLQMQRIQHYTNSEIDAQQQQLSRSTSASAAASASSSSSPSSPSSSSAQRMAASPAKAAPKPYRPHAVDRVLAVDSRSDSSPSMSPGSSGGGGAHGGVMINRPPNGAAVRSPSGVMPLTSKSMSGHTSGIIAAAETRSVDAAMLSTTPTMNMRLGKTFAERLLADGDVAQSFDASSMEVTRISGTTRTWTLGIVSRLPAKGIMTEALKTLHKLGFLWKFITPYQLRCRKTFVANSRRLQVKMAMQMYRVERQCYLLDFKLLEGEIFPFFELSAQILAEISQVVHVPSLPSSAPRPPLIASFFSSFLSKSKT